MPGKVNRWLFTANQTCTTTRPNHLTKPHLCPQPTNIPYRRFLFPASLNQSLGDNATCLHSIGPRPSEKCPRLVAFSECHRSLRRLRLPHHASFLHRGVRRDGNFLPQDGESVLKVRTMIHKPAERSPQRYFCPATADCSLSSASFESRGAVLKLVHPGHYPRLHS